MCSAVGSQASKSGRGDVGRNWHVEVVDPAGAPHGASDYRSKFRLVVDTRAGEGEYLGED